MVKKVRCLFFLILIFAVFSDQMHLLFLTNCDSSTVISLENLISMEENNNSEEPTDKQNHHEGCPFTVHLNHCSSHYFFFIAQKAIKISGNINKNASRQFYLNQAFGEQFLDSLFRPPKA